MTVSLMEPIVIGIINFVVALTVTYGLQRRRRRRLDPSAVGPCYVCRQQRDDLQELLAPLQVCVPCASDVFTEVEQAFAPWDHLKAGAVPQKREAEPVVLGPAARRLLEIGTVCHQNGAGDAFDQALALATEELRLLGKAQRRRRRDGLPPPPAPPPTRSPSPPIRVRNH